MEIDAALHQYQNERSELLKRLTHFLLFDRRVVAAWLIGSLGRGTSDVLSDINLWDEAICRGRLAGIMVVLGQPIFHCEQALGQFKHLGLE